MAAQTETRHRRLEGKSGLFAVITTGVILIGGVAEIFPILSVPGGSLAEALGIQPYTPLELAGRDIYVREGCYNCHSQMVRPMRSDTLRYGTWSHSQEYVYDRPFQFGSRRIGPDLHREGGREPGQSGQTGGRNDAWHWQHLLDPRAASEGSIMPDYPWLMANRIDPEDVAASMRALQTLGTPYSDADIAHVADSLRTEGQAMVERLAESNIRAEWDQEAVALIAYLQSLGRNRPLFDNQTGTSLGQSLYGYLSCGSCHGDSGQGGVPNPNADPDVMPAVNDLARRIGLTDAGQTQLTIALLTSGADLDAARAHPPFPGFDAVADALQQTRDELRYGRIVSPVDPARAHPQDMPNYGYRLTQRRIDAVLAYLLNLQTWAP